MNKTPKNLRLHIGIFGRRNAGKSSLLNTITNQNISIVSNIPGTTTDPVEKAMELHLIGPVLFIDTAGIDDDQEPLGQLRIEKTQKILNRTDIALLVVDFNSWNDYEEKILIQFQEKKIPYIVILNKADQGTIDTALVQSLQERNIPYIAFSCVTKQGLPELQALLLQYTPSEYFEIKKLTADLVQANETAILVIPIDKEAPKGRLILPQVQTIRDILDIPANCVITTPEQLPQTLDNLKTLPKVVITDSQVFHEVALHTPNSIPLTSFSILFANYKGDLTTQSIATLALNKLKDGDKILIAEACTHHPIADDIGRVKIPKWIREKVNKELIFESTQGHDFPNNLQEYKLIVHCGACMLNRKATLNRIYQAQQQNVPITNYGLIIAALHGILERTLTPFPDVLQQYQFAKNT
ncbi:MAG: [FeFe] hydrogenase H-cluster maturation GTPase HydF [Planctomycetes bacterium]|jgi:[FeFe] hydrogenase H-cluster maturation GTPase HydF|nr:[FeFe] hydrogenase H-cluster maturation GTPase HydF [Planctomycetota bacterium]HPY75121.1 [FeFe] hydrogenase H-cluster maturation GTPase HydF [Planctomycetota bacterium]HQB00689.1 [FeFe] hydrogenase H-cluster maturation GTPase HydF [Planctomycetota bacterium]